jgi:hypothetical protein
MSSKGPFQGLVIHQAIKLCVPPKVFPSGGHSAFLGVDEVMAEWVYSKVFCYEIGSCVLYNPANFRYFPLCSLPLC